MSKTGISEKKFQEVAKLLNCKVAAIKAVDFVESTGGGFLASGEVKILFEPHIFWKELRKLDITPKVSKICYPVWGTQPYGSINIQHDRLNEATKINREAALMSCSWGRFQIMGFNFKACGCKTLQEFLNKMYESEEAQLDLFANYIKTVFLDDELRGLDWKGFARGYNGPAYAKNQYDIKLKNAFLKFSK